MPTDPREQLAIFLRDVKDDPDDDTPRLVLADWLQDQGDPRGELIALDLELHRLRSDDPRRERIQQRQRSLLQRHAFDWLGQLIDLAGYWSFERGFIHIEARAERFLCDEVEELAAGELFWWVDSLRLEEVRGPHLARLAQSALLDVVPSLNLVANRFLGHHLGLLLASDRLLGLRTLRLARTGLGPEAAEAIASCAGLAGLRRLDLRRNPIGDAGALALARSPHLGGLTELRIWSENMSRDALAALYRRFGKGVIWRRTSTQDPA